jgi:putative tryptophan/tyrosine transport system substrate-binding protein
MRRRELITLFGGAAPVWPLAARAQQPAMPVIGFLHTTSPDTNAERLRAFRRGLKDAGFLEGENVTVEYRWAEGQFDRLPLLAADLVRRNVAVIAATGGSPTALAAKAATATIPIVFGIFDDPVRLGLVASLARPGGNATGVNFFNVELAAKRLELLHELVPAATRVAVLINPADASNAESQLSALNAAAATLALRLQVLKASSSDEIDAAFAQLARERPDALFVGSGAFFLSRRIQLVHLVTRHALVATYSSRDYAVAGGLLTYGTAVTDAYHQVGSMPVAYSRALSRRSCRSCNRPNSSWSSTVRPRRRWASTCPRRCSPAPTR